MAIYNGTPGDDVLLGTGADDTMNGGDGQDYLRGRGGNDLLAGGNGDDYLDGGFGDDVIDGGAGWDRAAFYADSVAGVQVDLNLQGVAQNTGQGFDTLIGIEHVSGTTFADTLVGNSGDNWVWGEGGNDSLSGNDGDDLVQTGAGNSTLSGGSGVDTASFDDNGTGLAAGAVAVSLLLQGAAQDTLNGSMILTGFENLSGSTGNDALTGDGGANVLAGYLGNDALSGGAGDDVLLGDGAITVDTHGTGFSGPIVTYQDITVVNGGPGGDDVLDGGLGDDVLNGGDGSDTASYAGAPGGVQVFLTAGVGSSSGAAGEDTLISIENVVGSAFDDQLLGNAAANAFSAGDGNDYMRSRGGDDSLSGGNGDDYLGGGFGNDLLDGGAGWDRVAYYNDATGGVHVDLNIQGVAQDTGQGLDTLIGIEHASGTTFDDVLIGNSGDNWLWGENGNDNFSAGAGNDLVEAGPGNSVADGGAGNDTFSLWGNDAPIAGVTLSLALMGAAQSTGIGSMTLTGFENLSGSNGNDALTGDGGANILAGDQGNDSLSGGDGDDLLLGDGRIIVDTHGVGTSGPITTYQDLAAAGMAELGDGKDTLTGGKGNDTLIGGGGDDVLTGGQGQDSFVFGPASGHDRITDFAKKDVILLSGIAGVDDFGDLTLAASGKDTLVSWGTGDSILIDGMKPKQLSAADFAFGSVAPAAAMAFDSHGAGPQPAVHGHEWLP